MTTRPAPSSLPAAAGEGPAWEQPSVLPPGAVVLLRMPSLAAGSYGPWLSTCRLGCMKQSSGGANKVPASKRVGSSPEPPGSWLLGRVRLRPEAHGSWHCLKAPGRKSVLLGTKSLLRGVSGIMGPVTPLPMFTFNKDLLPLFPVREWNGHFLKICHRGYWRCCYWSGWPCQGVCGRHWDKRVGTTGSAFQKTSPGAALTLTWPELTLTRSSLGQRG